MSISLNQNEKNLIRIFVVVLILFFFLYLYINLQKSTNIVTEEHLTVSPAVISNDNPKKTNFGEIPSPDFPTNIPLEEGVKINQSYSLDYIGQKQLTIVFMSMKTIKENYNLYADFLKKDNWNISNKYESKDLASLYAVKGQNEINVTISSNDSNTITKSMVSISVLKK